MGILLENNRFVTVIDRTLPEIVLAKGQQDQEQLREFCRLLQRIGADLIEVDQGVLRVLQGLPAGVDFIFRLKHLTELSLLSRYNIKRCIIGSECLPSVPLWKLADNLGIKMWVEFDARELSHLRSITVPEHCKVGGLEAIRLTGFSGHISQEWQHLNVKLDLCPDDTFFTGVATALEAMTSKLDCLTLSFTGFGRKTRFTPLEQALMAGKVLYGGDDRTDLACLPQMCRIFSACTGIRIPPNQPILGSHIFRYESGIHADGINKNPATYEPYAPDLVGQARKLVIGKHSGGSSIINKLAELGLNMAESNLPLVLSRIKEASILLHRDLTDEEFTGLIPSR